MENHKLPTRRPSRAMKQSLTGMTSDIGTFLPRTLSREAAKRERKALEETRIRVVVMKAQAILEKMAMDYRFAAKREMITRFSEEADYYVMLIDQAQTPGGQNLTRQAVQQFADDLYLFIWELSQDADEKTLDLFRRDLYPEAQEERDWLDSLGLFFSGRRS